MTNITNTTENTMTARIFFTAISENESLSADLREFAANEIVKMDKRLARRSSKPSKTQAENAPLVAKMEEFFAENAEGKFTASEMVTVASEGQEAPYSVQKISALLGQMVKGGILNSEEVKVKGKGKQKAYSYIPVDERVTEDEEVAEEVAE